MSEFDKLVKLFDNDKTTCRLHELREKGEYQADDPIFEYIYVLEFYQRLYEEMPKNLKELADSEAQFLASRCVEKIADSAASEIEKAIDRQIESTMLDDIKAMLAYVVVLAVAIATSDIIQRVENNRFLADFSFWRLIYHVPIGHVFMLGCIAYVALFVIKKLDKKTAGVFMMD